jgi:tryptophan-rich sensory protein
VWFDQLAKPVFYPPPATFGVVWTILYVMIAAAGWLAWRAGGGWRTTLPWTIQLGLNLGWTALFFGAQLPAVALLEIVLLLAAAIWATLAFRRHDITATALFIPYVVWIGFAAVLNGAIVIMN